MGELIVAGPFVRLSEKGQILPHDLADLRASIFADGIVSRGEAEALFALNASCTEKCADWPAFFVEAVTDYIVHQEKPHGYVSESNAQWLVRAISRDGRVDTATELEMLVTVLEKAKSAPASLSAYALRQVADAAIDGAGPVAEGRKFGGVISKADVDLVRRVLHAFGGEGNVAITQAEAEVLIEMNDRTVEEMNDPSWHDLFVKSVANFVMSTSGYEVPSRAEALRRDTFFERADADIGGFFARMVSGGVRGILDAYDKPTSLEDDWHDRNDRLETKLRSAESVTATEAQWLSERIGRDRLLRDNERALLTFIKQASPSIHPDLQPLLAKVA
jgi:hypothetical protein